MEDGLLSQLATALVVALVPVIIGALGWIARSLVSYLKARASAEQLAILQQVAGAAVAAVEQTLRSEKGQAKKEAALALVRSTLLARGIRLDEAAIEAAIEAAVYKELGLTITLPEDLSPALIEKLELPSDESDEDEPSEGPILA
jgi:LL-H family phage holin